MLNNNEKLVLTILLYSDGFALRRDLSELIRKKTGISLSRDSLRSCEKSLKSNKLIEVVKTPVRHYNADGTSYDLLKPTLFITKRGKEELEQEVHFWSQLWG